MFEGLPLLLHLIESAELDILTVPLATVADAYVAYLATHPVDAANLAQFVATAAQLILTVAQPAAARAVRRVAGRGRRHRRRGASPPAAGVPRHPKRGADLADRDS